MALRQRFACKHHKSYAPSVLRCMQTYWVVSIRVLNTTDLTALSTPTNLAPHDLIYTVCGLALLVYEVLSQRIWLLTTNLVITHCRWKPSVMLWKHYTSERLVSPCPCRLVAGLPSPSSLFAYVLPWRRGSISASFSWCGPTPQVTDRLTTPLPLWHSLSVPLWLCPRGFTRPKGLCDRDPSCHKTSFPSTTRDKRSTLRRWVLTHLPLCWSTTWSREHVFHCRHHRKKHVIRQIFYIPDPEVFNIRWQMFYICQMF